MPEPIKPKPAPSVEEPTPVVNTAIAPPLQPETPPAPKVRLIEFKPEQLVVPAKVLSFDRVLILPGINHQLTQEQVEKLISHPDFGRYVGKGIQVFESDAKPAPEIVKPDANSEYADLSGFTSDTTDDIILATNSTAILDRWLVNEKRVTVRRQLENRLTAIRGGRG